MAKEILDLFIEQNYPYELTLDFNASDGTDLETDYTCTFYSPSIGEKTFSVVTSAYYLELSAIDTNKLTTNMEEYTVYVTKIADSKKDKILSGRIVVDMKVT